MNLSTSLDTLASSAHNTMCSMHGLQVASINANHSRNTPSLRHVFMQMRRLLYDEWTSMQGFLHVSYKFSGEVITLYDNWEDCEDEEMEEYIRGLAVRLMKLEAASKALLAQHEELTKIFHESAAKLAQFLNHPSSARKNTHHSTDLANLPSVTTQVTNAPAPNLPMYTSFEVRGFVQSSVLAMYPDGMEAVSSISKSLDDTHRSLIAIGVFLESIRATYSTYTKPHFGTDSISILKDNDWIGYRAHFLSTIVSLTKTCDAISVEPAAPSLRAAKPPRQSSLQSSSKYPSVLVKLKQFNVSSYLIFFFRKRS